jgi:formamidopyrimidine-DNA glycosylase
MPELPETETMARDVHAGVRGQRIAAVRVTKADVLRGATPARLRKRVVGTSIERAWRRAKHIIIELSSGDRILVQPRFTGGLLIDEGQLGEEDRRYSTVEFVLGDGRSLHYRDVRRLGTVTLMEPKVFEAFEAKLGVEPLELEFTGERLGAILARSAQAVKKTIMDQHRLAGVGNIYANEALWRAGIDPSRAANSVQADRVVKLRDEIVSVLNEALGSRGTSFRDYRDGRGERGSFVERLAVYGRDGEPCLRCGTRLIGTHAIDGRMTVLCARCQS